MLPKTCVSCQESTRIYTKAPCPGRHTYCGGCLATMFAGRLSDRTLPPVRCCSVDLDPALVMIVLPLADVDRVLQILYEEAVQNKMHCVNPTCSAFLNLDAVGADFACPSCETRMCANCKVAYHEGMSCAEFKALPEDERGDVSLIILACNNQRLARCYCCRRMVQKTNGCNHMTCVCRAQFCFTCNKQWKTCSCA